MMQWDSKRWPNFTPGELWCRGSGKIAFHPGFLDALQALRAAWGHSMTINSACRSAEHNRKVSGHPRSLHICDEPAQPGQQGCLAVDVRTIDAATTRALVKLALDMGWSVGVSGKGFIHLDRRDMIGLPAGVFGY
jgi:hypothetical protein